MLQCLRVFVETKRVTGVWQWKHVANACKYMVGFGVIFFSALHENLYNLSYAGTSFALFPSSCFFFPSNFFKQIQKLDGGSRESCGCSVLFLRRCMGLLGMLHNICAAHTILTYHRDFFMDWGFGQWGSKNFPLRDELFYTRNKWVWVILYCYTAINHPIKHTSSITTLSSATSFSGSFGPSQSPRLFP